MSSLRACEVQPPAQGGIQILGALVGVLVGCAENCGASAVAMLVGVVQFLDMVVVPVGATTGGRLTLASLLIRIRVFDVVERWGHVDDVHAGLDRVFCRVSLQFLDHFRLFKGLKFGVLF